MMDRFQVGLMVLLSVGLVACESQQGGGEEGSAQAEQNTQTEGAPAVTELMIEDVAVGEGQEATAGNTAVVHYTGWLYDPSQPESKGQKFDSSRDRGETFSFPLGAGRVIQGWDQGVAGMKVGGRRMLTIPSDLAYGNRGAGGVIPPGATLLFDVELVGVE